MLHPDRNISLLYCAASLWILIVPVAKQLLFRRSYALGDTRPRIYIPIFCREGLVSLGPSYGPSGSPRGLLVWIDYGSQRAKAALKTCMFCGWATNAIP
jgi:hypothetical protein